MTQIEKKNKSPSKTKFSLLLEFSVWRKHSPLSNCSIWIFFWMFLLHCCSFIFFSAIICHNNSKQPWTRHTQWIPKYIYKCMGAFRGQEMCISLWTIKQPPVVPSVLVESVLSTVAVMWLLYTNENTCNDHWLHSEARKNMTESGFLLIIEVLIWYYIPSVKAM